MTFDRPVIEAALAEDGPDVTSEATIPEDMTGTADIVTRVAGVVAGLDVAGQVFDRVSADGVSVEHRRADGDNVGAGDVLVAVHGAVRDLLRAERVALNLLTHLSGIATLTRRWVDAVAGTGVIIRDTRKTLPGLRDLEKHAVRCGGGVNHRTSLSDAALIKDNHIAACGGVAEAFAAVRRRYPALSVEVECDTLDQVREALAAGAEMILLDNFSLGEMRKAVRLARGKALLEASGGLTLGEARDAAETGVDYLAVGALTHSAAALDIGMDLRSA